MARPTATPSSAQRPPPPSRADARDRLAAAPEEPLTPHDIYYQALLDMQAICEGASRSWQRECALAINDRIKFLRHSGESVRAQPSEEAPMAASSPVPTPPPYDAQAERDELLIRLAAVEAEIVRLVVDLVRCEAEAFARLTEEAS